MQKIKTLHNKRCDKTLRNQTQKVVVLLAIAFGLSACATGNYQWTEADRRANAQWGAMLNAVGNSSLVQPVQNNSRLERDPGYWNNPYNSPYSQRLPAQQPTQPINACNPYINPYCGSQGGY